MEIEVPSWEALFTGPEVTVVPASTDAYKDKPSGTSDQGYAED